MSPKYEIGFWYADMRCFSHITTEANTLTEAMLYFVEEMARWPQPTKLQFLAKDGQQLKIDRQNGKPIS